jgi:hypothetical protein
MTAAESRRWLHPLALGLLVAAAAPVQALDYQVHGFLAQGFLLSEGNDFYGDSTDGSFKFYEAGLNGTIKPLPQLLLSAQVLARDAGVTDDGKPRLDFAFADYAFVSGAAGDAGVRIGRVKNFFGLYNATRDVVFARPGVLLPSVYYDALGARSLLFSSDGVQAYGGVNWGDHYTSLVASYALSDELTYEPSDDFDGLTLDDFLVARLQDEWGGGRLTNALTYLQGRLEFGPGPGASLDFNLYQLSTRYNGDRYSVTMEYGITTYDSAFGEGSSDGLYLQGDYLVTPAWGLMARWDSTFSNRNDREGDACTENFAPADRHACFAHDFSVGANWRSPRHWGAWAEYHWIDGLATVSDEENSGNTPDAHWGMLLLMAAYRF